SDVCSSDLGSSVDVLLRPDDIVYSPQSELKALIVGKTFLGASTLYRLQLPTGNQLEGIFTSHADYPMGEEVGIAIAADHLVVFATRAASPRTRNCRRRGFGAT